MEAEDMGGGCNREHGAWLKSVRWEAVWNLECGNISNCYNTHSFRVEHLCGVQKHTEIKMVVMWADGEWISLSFVNKKFKSGFPLLTGGLGQAICLSRLHFSHHKVEYGAYMLWRGVWWGFSGIICRQNWAHYLLAPKLVLNHIGYWLIISDLQFIFQWKFVKTL